MGTDLHVLLANIFDLYRMISYLEWKYYQTTSNLSGFVCKKKLNDNVIYSEAFANS